MRRVSRVGCLAAVRASAVARPSMRLSSWARRASFIGSVFIFSRSSRTSRATAWNVARVVGEIRLRETSPSTLAAARASGGIGPSWSRRRGALERRGSWRRCCGAWRPPLAPSGRRPRGGNCSPCPWCVRTTADACSRRCLRRRDERRLLSLSPRSCREAPLARCRLMKATRSGGPVPRRDVVRPGTHTLSLSAPSGNPARGRVGSRRAGAEGPVDR